MTGLTQCAGHETVGRCGLEQLPNRRWILSALNVHNVGDRLEAPRMGDRVRPFDFDPQRFDPNGFRSRVFRVVYALTHRHAGEEVRQGTRPPFVGGPREGGSHGRAYGGHGCLIVALVDGQAERGCGLLPSHLRISSELPTHPLPEPSVNSTMGTPDTVLRMNLPFDRWKMPSSIPERASFPEGQGLHRPCGPARLNPQPSSRCLVGKARTLNITAL